MKTPALNRRKILIAAAALLPFPAAARSAGLPEMKVYRDPGCGCCHKWVMGLQADGFIISMEDDPDRAARRGAAGMPPEMGGCHTGFIAGYVIEGHVPSEDIVRLVREKPTAIGLAVPGMPMGSPGMETSGPADSYDVMLVKADGPAVVFASH